MKKIDSFENIYETIKTNNADKLNVAYEKANNEKNKRNIFILITCLIVDAIFIYLGLNNPLLTKTAGNNFFMFSIIQLLVPILFVDIFTFVLYSIIFSKNIGKYYILFKNTIIKDLLSYFYTNLNYLPQNILNQNTYNEGNYKEYYNRYRSDDYMTGKIEDKYDIEMANILTQKVERHTDSQGRSRTTTTTIFSGLFAKITLDKSIKTNLRIQRNSSVFGKSKLNMDSQEFEKYFDVLSENQIIGMQLLTSDVMQKLTDFYNTLNYRFDIVINNNIIYLRFHSGPMFETGSFKEGSIPKDTLNKYYNILNFINDLTHELIDTINSTEI